jgi:hypothetical protein
MTTLETTTTEPRSAEQIFAANGCDKNGTKLEAAKDEYFPGDDFCHRDRFGKQIDTLALDDDARCEARNAIDLDDDVAQIAEREALRAAALRSNGQHERADEAMRHAHVLRELAKKSVVHEATKTHDYRDKIANAVEWGDLSVVNGHLLAALKDDKSDHVMKAACARAIIEIAPFVGTDTGEDFNGAWLAKLADLPLRTAQDLIESANALESGFETLLIDTEHGTRTAFRKISAMSPTKRREAMTALKECLTLHLLEFAAKREKATRTRSVSLSELKALSAIGLNNPEGWAALTEQSVKDGKRWLATALDKAEAAAIRHGDNAEPRGRDAVVNGRRVLPRLTMQKLANERIYSL